MLRTTILEAKKLTFELSWPKSLAVYSRFNSMEPHHPLALLRLLVIVVASRPSFILREMMKNWCRPHSILPKCHSLLQFEQDQSRLIQEQYQACVRCHSRARSHWDLAPAIWKRISIYFHLDECLIIPFGLSKHPKYNILANWIKEWFPGNILLLSLQIRSTIVLKKPTGVSLRPTMDESKTAL